MCFQVSRSRKNIRSRLNKKSLVPQAVLAAAQWGFPVRGANGEILVFERGRRARSVPDAEAAIVEAQYRLAGSVVGFPGTRGSGGESGIVGVLLPVQAVLAVGTANSSFHYPAAVLAIAAVPHPVLATDGDNSGIDEAVVFPGLVESQDRVGRDLPVAPVGALGIAYAPGQSPDVGIPEFVVVAFFDKGWCVRMVELGTRWHIPLDAVVTGGFVQGVHPLARGEVAGGKPQTQAALLPAHRAIGVAQERRGLKSSACP